MQRVYSLKGLDCPHCSAKIETDAAKLDGILNSSINLMSQTLTLDADKFYDAIDDDVEKIVYKYEPDVEVSIKDDAAVPASKTDDGEEEEEDEDFKPRIARIAIGAVVYAAAAVMMHFSKNTYLAIAALAAAYIILGWDVVFRAVKNILKGSIFDENFLMTVSSIGAFCIGSYSEAAAVMLLYQIGEFFQDMAVGRSRKSIANLMDIRPDSANVVRDGKVVTVSPESVKIGDILIVKPGEKIPLDGIVNEGQTMLDTMALTGESVPRIVKTGDSVLSGCINESGVIKIEVTKTFSESTVSKILSLIQNASAKKAPSENFITKFARYYTPVVVILAAFIAVVFPFVFDGGFVKWVRQAFVFLVISCPCALVISIPLSFFGGIGSAARKGVLIKGSNYLEALSKLDTLVLDKTGTLTKGVFAVQEIIPADGYSKDDVLFAAAYAESYSNHPIAQSVKAHFKEKINSDIISDYTEISGKGISVRINGCGVLAGNMRLMDEFNINADKTEREGTVVYVASGGKYIGCIVISDTIKKDSAEALEELRNIGVKNIVMLTGDNEITASSVAQKLKIKKYFASLLPQDKVSKFEEIVSQKSGSGTTAFVGDGINDAPTLARADIGIAMGALGSDAAIEAADVVLMTDEVSSIAKAVKTAKRTRRIVTENIVMSLGIKLVFLVLGIFGIATMWEAIFSDVGVMMIAVLNSMRVLKSE